MNKKKYEVEFNEVEGTEICNTNAKLKQEPESQYDPAQDFDVFGELNTLQIQTKDEDNLTSVDNSESHTHNKDSKTTESSSDPSTPNHSQQLSNP